MRFLDKLLGVHWTLAKQGVSNPIEPYRAGYWHSLTVGKMSENWSKTPLSQSRGNRVFQDKQAGFQNLVSSHPASVEVWKSSIKEFPLGVAPRVFFTWQTAEIDITSMLRGIDSAALAMSEAELCFGQWQPGNLRKSGSKATRFWQHTIIYRLQEVSMHMRRYPAMLSKRIDPAMLVNYCLSAMSVELLGRNWFRADKMSPRQNKTIA